MKQKHFSFYFTVLILITFFLFSSCGSRKKIVYFQNSSNLGEGIFIQNNTEFNSVIMPNDNLFITVSAVNPDAVEVFNTSSFNRGTNISATGLDMCGYLVDQDGNINYPLVGEIHLGGLTKKDAVLLLEKAISKFVADPVVNIRYLNYKIQILGEVNHPGVYTVTDEKISIPQAIALAGDLTIYGDRQKVQVIRVENGEKQFHFIDLTTPDLFFSPYYYLHQNDVLYVAPNSTKAGSSTYNQNLPLLMSTISVTFTIISFFIRYKL